MNGTKFRCRSVAEFRFMEHYYEGTEIRTPYQIFTNQPRLYIVELDGSIDVCGDRCDDCTFCPGYKMVEARLFIRTQKLNRILK